MMPRVMVLVACVLCFSSHGAEKLSTDSIGQLIKAHYLSTHPGSDTSFQLTVTEHQVADLWDTLGIQVVKVIGFPGVESLPVDYFCYNGTVVTFAGYGLLSGMVADRAFYYTYTFGSGAQRSIVGRLLVDQGTVVKQETGGYEGIFLAVPKPTGDSVYVYTGGYQTFNNFVDISPTPFGTVVFRDSRLQIVDSTGQEIVPDYPPLRARETGRSVARGAGGSGTHSLLWCLASARPCLVDLRGRVAFWLSASSVGFDPVTGRTRVVVRQ